MHTGGKLEGRSLVKETIYGHDALNAPVLASGTTAQCGVVSADRALHMYPNKAKAVGVLFHAAVTVDAVC